MRRPERLIGCALFTLFTHMSVAEAEPARARPGHAPQKETRDQQVTFDDDLLDADLATPFGDPVFSRHLRPIHVLLIRPRTSFVPELYKSVERI